MDHTDLTAPVRPAGRSQTLFGREIDISVGRRGKGEKMRWGGVRGRGDVGAGGGGCTWKGEGRRDSLLRPAPFSLSRAHTAVVGVDGVGLPWPS